MAEKSETKTLDQGIGVESVKVGEKPRFRMVKKKFPRTYINILHDPRVVRGNTYAAFVIPSSLQKEFMRIKEEEEKRRRIILLPPKLPRVAYLSQKKKSDEDLEEQEEKQEENDKYYDDLEIPDEIQDNPYFYEDRPSSPQFIPLPPGREVATQIEEGELFDFDLEVESILEVVVGRSLVQARYELIEEDERKEYLEHKRKFEQKREFELVNLQRSEAARVRREEEKVRRQKQAFEKRNTDIISQKKLICKTFAKSHLKFLKRNSLNHLIEREFLKENHDLRLNNMIYNDLLPKIEKDTYQYFNIEKIVYNAIENKMKIDLISNHKQVVHKEKERIRILKEEKEIKLKLETENENKRKQERAEHIENKRFNRITNSIKSNIISTKITKQDLIYIPLSDIDEFNFKSENIHCIGGQIGQAMIILDQTLRKLVENNIISNESVKVPEFIDKFLEEFLLDQLKEIQNLELRFLESSKYDFGEIPAEEDKRKEYHSFMVDHRRFVNKSVKILLENEILTEYVYTSFLEGIAKIFLYQPLDPNSIEIDPNIQEDEYLEEIEQKKAGIEIKNKKMEKLKKKIKLNFVKADDLKKKRSNIGGFVTVLPNKSVIDSLIEIEEPVVTVSITASNNENIKSAENNNNDTQKLDKGLNLEEDKIKSLVVENPNAPAENIIDNNEPIEPIKIKMDYLNEIDLFKNVNVPIDTYILHFDMTECFLAYTLRSIKRVLSREYKVSIDLNQSFNSIRDKINEINMIVYDHIMKIEKYLGKSIIPVEVKPELPVDNEADINAITN